MRSNMLKVEVMPVSLIVILITFALMCAFIGNYLIIKGIKSLENEQNYINFVLEDTENQQL